MKIYGNPMSTCTRKVLMTIAEKGGSAELVTVDLGKQEQKSAEHVARHPFGVVPVLDDDGFVIYESRAIIRYLDHRLEGQDLTPSDTRERARMDQWMQIEQSYLTPNLMQILYNTLFAKMFGRPVDKDALAKGKAGTEKALDVLEKHLESGTKYLAGDTFSLAEITWMPYLEYLFPAEHGDLINSRARTKAWWETISSRPTWKHVTGK
jgi:glutathione S-transferase